MTSESHNHDRSNPRSRFMIGFAVGGGFSFIGVLLNSVGESARSAFILAIATGIVLGTITGIVSVFGKKWLDFVIYFFTTIGL